MARSDPNGSACSHCGVRNPSGRTHCAGCGSALPDPGWPSVEGYTLQAPIGEGSMGVVYRATSSDGEPVAVKILHPHVAADPRAVARFEREASAQSQIETDHIVRVVGFGSNEDGALFLVMEFVDGPNLLQRISEGACSFAQIATWMQDILTGLEAAHRAGILHRDLKPENVVIDTDTDRALLCDFGIAKLLDHEGTSITATGIVCGTPEYMAPEQIRGQTLDARTDVYAAGCLLFRLLTGRYAYRASSALDTMGMHLMREVPEAIDTNPQVPRSLSDVAKRAMSKRPADRFPSAQAMRDALSQAAEAAGRALDQEVGRPVADTGASSIRLPVRSGLRWLFAATLLVLVAVALWRFF